MSIREDVELYTKLSGEDGSHETIATIGGISSWIQTRQRGCRTALDSSDGEVARYESERFLGILSGHALDTVIAWMPLPESYKGVTT